MSNDTSGQLLEKFARVVEKAGDGELFLRLPERGVDSPNGRFSLIPLKSIFAVNSPHADHPGLTERDLQLCEAFLATNVPGHPFYIRNNRGKRVKILFDENLPYGLVPALTHELPNLSHVYLEGMKGYADEFIYNRPNYCLKKKTPYEAMRDRTTKYIIITRDSDLTDLARAQWKRRMVVSHDPENIMFDDVNVVFRVTDERLTSLENIGQFKKMAREIMRLAYSGDSASYIIGKSGVVPEPGSRKKQLLHEVEETIKVDRAKLGQLTAAEIEAGKTTRWRGMYHAPEACSLRTSQYLALA